LQIFWDKMGYDSDNRPNFMPCFSSKLDFLQKNHFTINKISISGFIYNAKWHFEQPQYDKASILW
jgi:hypothetical protein